MIQCSWGLRGPDRLLPSSHLIQSCCSKVLPIAATIWCSEVYGGHKQCWSIFTLIEPFIFEGNSSNAVMALVARWQVYSIGMASNSVDKLISIDTFLVPENE